MIAVVLAAAALGVAAGRPQDSGDANSLLAAVNTGDPKAVVSLLNEGADLNVADRSGARPLIIAARLGDLEIVQILVDAGADTDTRDNGGRRSSSRARANKLRLSIYSWTAAIQWTARHVTERQLS